MNIMLNETAYMPIAAPELVTRELYIRRTDGLMYQQKKRMQGLPRWQKKRRHISEMGGKVVKRCIHAYICSDCTERLRHKLEDFLDVKEIDYFGNAIQWKEFVHG